jgi:hypothetical protein
MPGASRAGVKGRQQVISRRVRPAVVDEPGGEDDLVGPPLKAVDQGALGRDEITGEGSRRGDAG